MHIEKFAELLNWPSRSQVKVADLNFAMMVLTDVVSKYRKLLRLAGSETDFYLKV